MTVRELLDRFERTGLQLTVYGPEPDATVTERLSSEHIAVDWKELPTASSEAFVVIRDQSGFAGVVPLDDLRTFLSDPPTLGRPGDRSAVDESIQQILETLTNVPISALRRPQLLATAQEFEDRAYRVGHGTLRVSFQSLSRFRAQFERYQHLADDTALDIHVYGHGDWYPPSIPGVTVHAVSDDEIERLWLLAFDGGGDDDHKCGLVAEDLGDDRFRGFWTYDAAVVDEVMAELAAVDG
ncbi:DICT sensory domain-containing protein [Haloarcula salina]|uniref:DICT sensory domain-containing protein n=1 Tax=Haloarcula salina TaxID=1429914 RepID=UPI003C7014CC